MSKKALREKILAAEDIKPEPVDIPEWGVGENHGVPVYLRALDGEDRFAISQIAAAADSKKENIYITEAYVALALVDEDGDRIFELEERGALAKKDPQVLERLFDRIVEISGMRTEDEAAAEKK